jgi:Kef-type K+ transport system membrane component KefB
MANVTACIKPMVDTSNGVFQGDNPVHFGLPLIIVQIILVIVVTRLLGLLVKPLHEPRVIAEIVGGLLLGPSALGRSKAYMANIFPPQSMTTLEVLADMGLLFFLFMVGLELDLKQISKTGRQALMIAAAGISLPFTAGVGVSFVLKQTIAQDGKFGPFLVFMGVAMSITAFPVLARILAERKLLTTDVGQIAMSAAAVNDVVAWVLLALAVALSGSGKSPTIVVWVLLCGIGFVIVMFVAVRPVMTWIASRCTTNEPVKEFYICVTLAGVLAAGFCTDAIGIHSIFGAFLLGLVIPKQGPFAEILVEKLEDFITILFLPLYFAVSGLKTNIGTIHGGRSVGLLVLVISVACVGKILGTFCAAKLSNLNFNKSITLGVLMNTKGLVELIVLNIGLARGVLNEQTFAIMVLMALFTTFITTPLVMAIYKPARNPIPYTRRKLDMEDDPKNDFRILSCVHGMKNVPAMINLMETTRGIRKRALRLYILHLMELSERTSAIMMVQRARRDGRPFVNEGNPDSRDQVVVAFDAYGQLSKVSQLKP